MTSVWVKGVVFSRLFTFLPSMRASKLLPIDDKPKPMPSPLNYSAYRQLSFVIKNYERMEDEWILWMKKHWYELNLQDIESSPIKDCFFAHCGVVVSSMARVNMVWIMQCSHFLPKQMRLLFRVYEYTKEGFFFQAHHLTCFKLATRIV